jgi:hypothetical protein
MIFEELIVMANRAVKPGPVLHRPGNEIHF